MIRQIFFMNVYSCSAYIILLLSFPVYHFTFSMGIFYTSIHPVWTTAATKRNRGGNLYVIILRLGETQSGINSPQLPPQQKLVKSTFCQSILIKKSIYLSHREHGPFWYLKGSFLHYISSGFVHLVATLSPRNPLLMYKSFDLPKMCNSWPVNNF